MSFIDKETRCTYKVKLKINQYKIDIKNQCKNI